jgi:hypothetical protein
LIPPQASFKLVSFPPATNGRMTPRRALRPGGVMLKSTMRWQASKKTFIQYLPPSLLEEQVDEILAEAKGSWTRRSAKTCGRPSLGRCSKQLIDLEARPLC